MEKHAYLITVEHLGAPHGESVRKDPLCFEASNRDNIFAIADHLKQQPDFTPEQAQAFAVGLKLFGNILLEKKEFPVFEAFMPQFVTFMKALKKRPA